MIAYIDEAGDIGTGGRGTRWFVFGCVMVADANIEEMRTRAHAAEQIVGRDLHFRDLSHDDRIGVIEFLRDAPFMGVIVATDTTKAKKRISMYAQELGEPATIYFEHRRGFDYSGLDRYMTRLINDPDEHWFDSNYLSPGRISRMRKNDDPILGVADGLAYAGFRALEPHRKWKSYETSYLGRFTPSLWRGPASDQNIRTWGVVLMPTMLRTEFGQEYPWLESLAAK